MEQMAKMGMKQATFFWALCLCLTWGMASAAEEEAPSWGEPALRQYGQPNQAERIREHSPTTREEAGEELITAPLVESEEPRIIPPTEVVRERPAVDDQEKVKRYGLPAEAELPNENVAEPEPEDVGETELETELLLDERSSQTPSAQAPRSFRAYLDRDQVHLDENFTLTVEITVSDLAALSRFRWSPGQDLDVINTYQSDTVSPQAGQMWKVRIKRYVCLARRTGQIAVPAVGITYAGKSFFTPALSVTAEGARSSYMYRRQFSGQKAGQTGWVPTAPEVGGGGGVESIEVSAWADPTSVYFNQAVLLTVRLRYSLDDRTQVSYQAPQLSGFIMMELIPKKSEDIVSVQHQRFIDQTYQTVLFPVRAGSAQIGPAQITLTQENKNRRETTEAITISVNPLPPDDQAPRAQPASGLVGTYQLSAAWESRSVSEQTPFELTLTLAGEGNIRSAPEPVWNPGRICRVYLESQQDREEARGQAVWGERRYHYLLAFNQPGDLPLGKAEVRYFNPKSGKWLSAVAELPTVTVVPQTRLKAEVAPDRVDTRSAKLNPNHIQHERLRLQGETRLTSAGFWLLQALGPLLWLAAFFGKRMHQRALADPQVVRTRRAYASAQRSLRRLKKHIHEGEVQRFYDGLAKTATEYLAAKFGRPTATIGMERLPYYWQHYQIPEKLSAHFKAALTACEYVRFAAVVLPVKDMMALHRDLKNTINEFEVFWINRLRRLRTPRHTAALLLLGWGLSVTGLAFSAQEAELHFMRGNAHAEKERWEKAEEEYRVAIAMNVEDADLYYNLGNAYLRQGKIGPAILAYQRSQRLVPRDRDVQHNLDVAQGFLQRNESVQAQGVWGGWFLTKLYPAFTADELAVAASLIYFIAMGVLILLHLGPIPLRRWRWTVAVLALLTLALAGWSAARATESQWRRAAVVMVPQAKVFTRPYLEAEMIFQLEAGTTVHIQQEEETWVEVRFGQTYHGWMPRSAVAFVE